MLAAKLFYEDQVFTFWEHTGKVHHEHTAVLSNSKWTIWSHSKAQTKTLEAQTHSSEGKCPFKFT